MTYEIDVVSGGIESGIEISRFDKSLASMVRKGHRPIKLFQNAQLRIVQGPKATISRNGNYVSEGGIHCGGEIGIIVAKTPYLLDPKIREMAIEEHKRRRFFSTDDKELYNQFKVIAEEDVSKHPRERRAVFMPSNRSFEISPNVNREIFEFLLKEFGQQYLDFIEQDSLIYIPISQEKLEEYSDTWTVPTQLLFSGLDGDRCNLVGDGLLGKLTNKEVGNYYLDGGFSLNNVSYDICISGSGLSDVSNGIRGVRQVVSTEGTTDTSQISTLQEREHYTPAQIAEVLNELGIAKDLESKIQEALKQKRK